MASGGDYYYSTYMHYLQVGDALPRPLLLAPVSPSITQKLDGQFEAKLFHGRFGNAKQEGWTPVTSLYTRHIMVRDHELCLSYDARYPFSGHLRVCTDGAREDTLGFAQGVTTWEEAKKRAEELLIARFDLNIRNAEHFEGRQPRSFDVALVDGHWQLTLKYEGRRRLRPYWIYVVTLAVEGGGVIDIERVPYPY